MVMGKGGVGKTTVAAAVAVGLAYRGKSVHLTTTDPAQHLVETLPERVRNLTVSRIDPKEVVRLYRERMLVSAKATKSPEQLALLKEELQSPCYEEVTVFRAFSRAVISGRKAFMVIDTAPTGHTLLLLDTAGAYRLSCGPVIPSISGMIPLSPVVAAPDGGSTITTSLLPINAVMRNQDRLCCCGIKVV